MDIHCWWFSQKVNQLYTASALYNGNMDVHNDWRAIWKNPLNLLLLEVSSDVFHWAACYNVECGCGYSLDSLTYSCDYSELTGEKLMINVWTCSHCPFTKGDRIDLMETHFFNSLICCTTDFHCFCKWATTTEKLSDGTSDPRWKKISPIHSRPNEAILSAQSLEVSSTSDHASVDSKYMHPAACKHLGCLRTEDRIFFIQSCILRSLNRNVHIFNSALESWYPQLRPSGSPWAKEHRCQLLEKSPYLLIYWVKWDFEFEKFRLP